MYKILMVLFTYLAFNTSPLLSRSDTGSTDKTIDLTIQLDEKSLLNAYITDFYPTTNFRNDGDFAAVTWKTSTDTIYIGRSLFKIDLSVIPKNVTITSAQLYLNHNSTPVHYGGSGHHKDGGSNACYIQRITQKWDTDSVTWSNQPDVSSENVIILNSSTSDDQNYIVDITAVLNDMLMNPSNNFGFMLRLQTESPIVALGFSSGSCANYNERPILQISYTMQ
jgi:hypothetical protein